MSFPHITLSDVFLVVQWISLFYFLGMYGGYLMLNLLSVISIIKYMPSHTVEAMPKVYTDLEIPVSVLVPAYNEQETIATSVNALLQMTYPEYEIVVVNDGSKDKTLDALMTHFALVPVPETVRVRIKTKRIKTIYQSTIYPNLRVIDKDNGGKADSLNAGINAARYPLFCGVDADSILQPNSLERIVQPFIEDSTTVASGGTVRIANGCDVRKGFLVKPGLPKNILALFQVAEYLRAFLFGRLGWSPLNALLIISGAFGVFHKETVISVGGYRTDCIGEDMELIVRMHRILRQQKRKYKITFVPDPICWTEAPEDMATLRKQRIRWHRGLSESLTKNISLMFHPRGGAVGWIAFPYMLIFEWLGPIVEIMGLVSMGLGFYFGYIPKEIFVLFLFIAIGFGVLLSVIAILLEEISFHIYPKASYMIVLFFVTIIENFGYRQLNMIWRSIALFQWAIGSQAKWGDMKRKGSEDSEATAIQPNKSG
ncbi:MAG: glycosyltransferase family 2 protein [Gammaproteobacteria bacterium]|nr:glycosyltransferase family 2 protein [Gammaproteobacteria bacterium]MDH5693580.1 glycosyltransferase family 2 protein [Gammaproteobacteria bacterium]